DFWLAYTITNDCLFFYIIQSSCVSAYTIYHASFLDFLKSKREMDSKRKMFKEVNQRITEYLEEGMA
ncbi:hypothetical protein, partial [Microcoleus sp. B4-D4]|uniref:hypothetical protein n=1 Tax=Microcoleus sp. B4-D4 TaxID=2818667 RepID=UPI002FD15E41